MCWYGTDHLTWFHVPCLDTVIHRATKEVFLTAGDHVTSCDTMLPCARSCDHGDQNDTVYVLVKPLSYPWAHRASTMPSCPVSVFRHLKLVVSHTWRVIDWRDAKIRFPFKLVMVLWLTLMVLSDEALKSRSPEMHKAHTGPWRRSREHTYNEKTFLVINIKYSTPFLLKIQAHVCVRACVCARVCVCVLTAWPTKVPLHLKRWWESIARKKRGRH